MFYIRLNNAKKFLNEQKLLIEQKKDGIVTINTISMTHNLLLFEINKKV